MEHACCITTCPRKGVSYLSDTVEGIRAAGFRNICVSAEPGSDLKDADYDSLWCNAERLGSWKNMLTAFDFCLSQFHFADFIFYFQDDIQIAKGAMQHMADSWADRMESEDAVAYMYTPAYMDDLTGDGEWWTPEAVNLNEVRKAGGTLGVMTPRRFAEAICSSGMRWDKTHLCDTAFGHFCKNSKWKIYRPKTSTVQHVGVMSSIKDRKVKNCKYRMASNFVHEVKSEG